MDAGNAKSNGSIAWREVEAARRYTHGLLSDIEDDDWFRQPAEGVTHIAWQVGHLAFAEFMLILSRIHGADPGPGQALPAEYVTLFGRDSIPSSDRASYPTPAEIGAVFDGVHAQAQQVITRYSDEDLSGEVHRSHKLFTKKLDAIFWCARHEMLHAGQIGLLKRLWGRQPQW